MLGLFKKKKVESLGDYQPKSNTAKHNQEPNLTGVQLDVSPCTEKNVLASIRILRELAPYSGLREIKDIAKKGGILKTNLTTQEVNMYVYQLNDLGTKAKIVGDSYHQQMNDVTANSSNTEQVFGEEMTLILVNSGRAKMAVIKVIREAVPSLGLREAKALADHGGKVITANGQIIKKIESKLEAVGAKIEIK